MTTNNRVARYEKEENDGKGRDRKLQSLLKGERERAACTT
jgi:hypothetical protein